MTARGVREVLPDGTRVYWTGNRYKPKSPEARVIGVRRPEVQGAVRFHGQWFVPRSFLADDLRVLPETRPDCLAYDHMGKRGRACDCSVCQRPAAQRWKRKWLRDRGLRP